MKVNITGHETVLTPEIKKYAEKKMDKLCKHYKVILSGDVVLEENHNKIEKKAAVAKVTLKVAGHDIAAHAEEKTVFAAIDEVERKLVSQLEKTKATKSPKAKKVVRSKSLLHRLFSKDSEE